LDFLAADSLPWLQDAQEQIRKAAAAGRLPHSLLLLSVPGLGAESLAFWIAAFALCEAGGPRPCGACASCLLLRSESHPDLHRVRLEEDAKQIKVEQIRELIDVLALKSYRGGYKLALIEGAELLNANGANAFLKNLEEPAQNTLLILVTKPNHRLPATIASRCMRLKLHVPAPDLAKVWLRMHADAAQDWDAALALAGGAPLAAVELDAARLVELDRDMQAGVVQLSAGAVDVTLLAEQWLRSNPLLRLTWLENWITRRVHAGLCADSGRETAEQVRLPAALLKAKIRGLFALLDAIRDFRRLASSSVNQQLAMEALLLGGRDALAN
jgi:DNA polymerase III subunit delta'